ncbi:MAG: putative inorganic carbon transporter subunit DabA, partial [Gammaproteobacteria bacterium]
MTARSVESAALAARTSYVEGHEWLRHLIAEACEPIAQFWPMKNFVHHNPIHGLEHLPFDKAVREAKHLLGGNGYLSNKEYRQLYREGRITAEGVIRALQRVGPRVAGYIRNQGGCPRVEGTDVLRGHLLIGFEPLESTLLSWTFGPEGAARRFPRDLPFESRQLILARWKREGGSSQDAEKAYLSDLWKSTLQAVPYGDDQATAASAEVVLPARRTVADWLDMLAAASIVEQVNDHMMKWVMAFVDEGMAGWEMPSRHEGFYHAWRDLAPRDFSGRFLGIKDFSQRVRALPAWPEDAIILSLERLEVPQKRWTEYLSRHLAQLPGWAGYIRWLGENPAYPGQAGHPVDPVQYLTVRLFYEVELTDALCRRKWGIPGTVSALVSHWQKDPKEYQRLIAPRAAVEDSHTEAMCRQAWRLFRLAQFLELTPVAVRAFSSEDVQTLLGWLDSFPENEHGPVWLEAYEDKYREDLLTQLAAHRGKKAKTEVRPRAQIVFCIDVRSESFRRHVEAQGPYETHGFAGFFGVAMNHQAFDSKERFPLCPVLLKPAHAVDEAARPEQMKALQGYASGTRWGRLGDHLFHDLKQNPVASFMLVDLLGFFFSLGLAGKTLAPRLHEFIKARIRKWFHPSVATRIQVDKIGGKENGSGSLGFTREEQASMVENGLRAIGLTKNFGRFIVLCGHGSISDNNPYFGALHCG